MLIPANNKTETPYKTRTGHTVLYCWDTETGDHVYLCLDDDMVIHPEWWVQYGITW